MHYFDIQKEPTLIGICFFIGYFKRGLCFFNLGMYDKCRIDLLLAEQTGLPQQMKPLLERHKETCRLMLERNPPIVEVEPILSFPPDPLFPEMANVLQINYNEMDGRHIIAKEAIGVGQIVSETKPPILALIVYS